MCKIYLSKNQENLVISFTFAELIPPVFYGNLLLGNQHKNFSLNSQKGASRKAELRLALTKGNSILAP